jgi:hypothetical protein
VGGDVTPAGENVISEPPADAPEPPPTPAPVSLPRQHVWLLACWSASLQLRLYSLIAGGVTVAIMYSYAVEMSVCSCICCWMVFERGASLTLAAWWCCRAPPSPSFPLRCPHLHQHPLRLTHHHRR